MAYNQPYSDSPLVMALKEELFRTVDYLLNHGHLSYAVAEELRKLWLNNVYNVADSLARKYGQSTPGQAITDEISVFIREMTNRMNGGSNCGYGGNIGYGGSPFGGGGLGGGGGYTNGGSIFGNPGGSQQSPFGGRSSIYSTAENTQSRQPEPVMQYDHEEAYADKGPAVQAPTYEQYSQANIVDMSSAEIGKYHIENVQTCTYGKFFTSANGIKHRVVGMKIHTPEVSVKDMLRAFAMTNPLLLDKAFWAVDIIFNEMSIIDVPLNDSKKAIEEVGKAYREKNWISALDVMESHSKKFFSAMEKALVAEINDLLAKYAQTREGNPALEIEELRDIEELFSLSSTKPDSLTTSETYQPVIQSIVNKAFNKFFSEKPKTLTVPDDIPLISKHPDFVIRTPEFTESTPVAEMTKDGVVNPAYLKAFSSKTVILTERRILYTNILPKNFTLHMAGRAVDDTIIIPAVDNVLSEIMVNCSKGGLSMDVRIDSQMVGIPIHLGIGHTITGELTVIQK